MLLISMRNVSENSYSVCIRKYLYRSYFLLLLIEKSAISALIWLKYFLQRNRDCCIWVLLVQNEYILNVNVVDHMINNIWFEKRTWHSYSNHYFWDLFLEKNTGSSVAKNASFVSQIYTFTFILIYSYLIAFSLFYIAFFNYPFNILLENYFICIIFTYSYF